MGKASRLIAFSLALATGTVAVPVSAVQAQGPGGATTLEDVRDQGILYFNKDLHKQARGFLDRAWKMPGGQADFRTAYYRAATYFKLLIVEEAFSSALKAEQLADNDRHKRRIGDLLTEMRSLFGAVTLTAAEGETNKKGRIFFEAQTGIINRAKKQRFMSIRERFRSTDIALPITVYLPWGEYTANKVPFALVQGEDAPSLEIFLQVDRTNEPKGGGLSTMQWVWIGVGGAVLVAGAATAAVLLQAPEDEVVTGLRIGSDPNR